MLFLYEIRLVIFFAFPLFSKKVWRPISGLKKIQQKNSAVEQNNQNNISHSYIRKTWMKSRIITLFGVIVSLYIMFYCTLAISYPLTCSSPYYFDQNSFSCKTCTKDNSELSSDGTFCQCQEGYRKITSTDGDWSCSACPSSQVYHFSFKIIQSKVVDSNFKKFARLHQETDRLVSLVTTPVAITQHPKTAIVQLDSILVSIILFILKFLSKFTKKKKKKVEKENGGFLTSKKCSNCTSPSYLTDKYTCSACSDANMIYSGTTCECTSSFILVCFLFCKKIQVLFFFLLKTKKNNKVSWKLSAKNNIQWNHQHVSSRIFICCTIPTSLSIKQIFHFEWWVN